MKIIKAFIPKAEFDNGIEDIDMKRIGDVVLLAGKNGSGKSRILQKIKYANDIKQRAESTQKQFKIMTQQLTESGMNPDTINNLKTTSTDTNGELKELISNFLHYKNRVHTVIETDSDIVRVIEFVPKNLKLSISSFLTPRELKAKADNIDRAGMSELAEGTTPKIQTIQNRWFHATHPLTSISDEDKKLAIDDYKNLQYLIEKFLNTTLKRNVNNEAMLFDLPLDEKANLSDGQIILLQFCLAIFSQKAQLKDIILILDEPENHLHPSVIIDTISRIQENLINGQIWIATHSIPLLAHFDSSNIWYVDKGTVSYAGDIPEIVLESLLGNEEEIAKLQDFINLPAQLAINKYAFECLFLPSAISTGRDDPQGFQIRETITSISDGKKLKILDYGAGKGRILSNIIEHWNKPISTLEEEIEYIAFDEYPTDELICREVIRTGYSSDNNRYFNSLTELRSHYDTGSFDVLLMCNVLHEIHPNQWLNLFRANGDITTLLSPSGKLVIVEDMQIPIGEKAHEAGFIVFNTEQLKELFKITEKDKEQGFSYDAKKEGRLKAHIIPKDCLSRITHESKVAALESLHKLAITEILSIRNEGTTYKNGKIHSYWVQQLANTTIALSEIK